MDEDPNGRGEAGGVAGEMSVAKRSSMSGLAGGVEERVGIRGGMERSGEGIPEFFLNFDFGSKA